MDAHETLDAAEACFRAVLLPHRSLGRKEFVTLIVFVGMVGILGVVGFHVRGAWPVAVFFGLNVTALYFAFWVNYRAARTYETVELTESELRLTRVHPSGRAESWTFNPYWVRLELEEQHNIVNRLRLRSHGRVLNFGAFLTDEEKRSFAAALRTALHDVRNASA